MIKTVIISIVCGVGGVALGFIAPLIPYAYMKYFAIAIMAAFDSIIGAWTAYTKDTFDLNIFVSGFFINAIIAIAFTMMGEALNVDIYSVANFVFVFRIFNNLSIIRRYFLEEHAKKRTEK